jgi:hypothetical protein
MAKAAGQRKSPFLWPLRQRPTLQIRNVVERLPEEQKDQVKAAMRASYNSRNRMTHNVEQ